jgi:hypothetical protein
MPDFTIDQPLNREVLLYLMTISAVYERSFEHAPLKTPEFISDGQMSLSGLRVHPDLGGLLSSLAEELPGVTHGYVLGYDVLVNPQGVIFAFATGMMFLSFRVNPPVKQASAPKPPGVSIEDLSKEWHTTTPFNETNALARLRPLAERALTQANQHCAPLTNVQGPQPKDPPPARDKQADKSKHLSSDKKPPRL